MKGDILTIPPATAFTTNGPVPKFDTPASEAAEQQVNAIVPIVAKGIWKLKKGLELHAVNPNYFADATGSGQVLGWMTSVFSACQQQP